MTQRNETYGPDGAMFVPFIYTDMNMINDKRISRPDEAPEHPVPGLVPVAAQPLPAAGQQGGVLLVPVAHAGVLVPVHIKISKYYVYFLIKSG